MKLRLLITFLLLGSLGISISGNPADTTEPVLVSGICGRLVAGSGREVKSIEHTRIRLFSPTGTADCCSLTTPIAEATTDMTANFNSKSLSLVTTGSPPRLLALSIKC